MFSVEEARNVERTDTEMALVSSQPGSSMGEVVEEVVEEVPEQEITTKDVECVEPMDLQEGCSYENDREEGGEVVVDEENMEDGSQDSSISVAGNLNEIHQTYGNHCKNVEITAKSWTVLTVAKF